MSIDFANLSKQIANLREETQEFRTDLDRMTDKDIEEEIERQEKLRYDAEWKITAFEAEQQLRKLKSLCGGKA